MYVYRFEYPDGGSPFCTLDGVVRDCNFHAEFNDSGIYGCKDLEQLKEYFQRQQCIIKNCKIFRYDVPIEEIEFLKREIIFPRQYKKNGVQINIDLFKNKEPL